MEQCFVYGQASELYAGSHLDSDILSYESDQDDNVDESFNVSSLSATPCNQKSKPRINSKKEENLFSPQVASSVEKYLDSDDSDLEFDLRSEHSSSDDEE